MKKVWSKAGVAIGSPLMLANTYLTYRVATSETLETHEKFDLACVLGATSLMAACITVAAVMTLTGPEKPDQTS